MRPSFSIDFFHPTLRATLWLTLLSGAAVLAGCGDKSKDKDKDKPATQTAAKVNKEEITVHQINYVLGQQRVAIAADRAASASARILEGLIDQELAIEKAAELKLDRDPAIARAIDASRRDIISRAYFEKVGQGAPKATAKEIEDYYAAHPALFGQRRVYNIQEVDIQAEPQKIEELKSVLASKNVSDFVAYLKDNNIRYGASQAFRAAEQLPLASLNQFAALKDGQTIFTPVPNGAMLLHLLGSRTQPVSLDQAKPAIEVYLLNERKRKLIEDDLKSLRSNAKIEYVGDFQKTAGAGRSTAPEPTPPATTPAAAPVIAPFASAAPQIDVAPLSAASSAMPATTTLDKGLQGLK